MDQWADRAPYQIACTAHLAETVRLDLCPNPVHPLEQALEWRCACVHTIVSDVGFGINTQISVPVQPCRLSISESQTCLSERWYTSGILEPN